MAEKGLDIVFVPTNELPDDVKPVSASDLSRIPSIVAPIQTEYHDLTSSSNCMLPEEPQVASIPLPTSPATPVGVFGIDFSKPPPLPAAEMTTDISNITPQTPPSSVSPYEPPAEQGNHYSKSHYYPKRQNHYNNNYRRFEHKYAPPIARPVSRRIPTIVSRAVERVEPEADYSSKLVSPRSYDSRKTYEYENSYAPDYRLSRDRVGKSIEVVTRTGYGAAPNHTFPKPEKVPPRSFYKPIPKLISHQIDEIPLPMLTESPSIYPAESENSNNILISPTERPLPKLYAAPQLKQQITAPEKVKKKVKALPKSASSGGISIPLSKIISKSTIPSLSTNTPMNKKIPSLRQPFNHEQIPNNSHFMPARHDASLPQYTSFDSPVTASTNSNLITVLTPTKNTFPQVNSNLQQIPLTEIPVEPVPRPNIYSHQNLSSETGNETLLMDSAPFVPTTTDISAGNYNAYNFSVNYDYDNKSLAPLNNYNYEYDEERSGQQDQDIDVHCSSYIEPNPAAASDSDYYYYQYMPGETPPPPGTSP